MAAASAPTTTAQLCCSMSPAAEQNGGMGTAADPNGGMSPAEQKNGGISPA